MARTCTVCRCCERDEVDALLIEGRSPLRQLASNFGLSASALQRHKLQHIPGALERAQHASDIARSDSLLDHVRALQSRSATILQKAEGSGDLRTALGALRELRGILELLARLAIKNGAVVEIAVVEAYVEKVIEVLSEFVPQERLEAAILKLTDLIESETMTGGRPSRGSDAISTSIDR